MSRKAKRRCIDGIILLDKPTGLSSNAALQQVRRMLDADKAGHTGSLDPLATGMLPICLGAATRLSGYLLDSDKSYVARARLGIKTSTGDSEGAAIASLECALTREALTELIPKFSGNITQIPPMYSAIKREGRKLYELAREGIEVERQPRPAVIHDLKMLNFDGQHFEFSVRCSKGTYIRTLAEDWAQAAGSFAHLVALRRTAVDPFDVRCMVTFEALSDQIRESGDLPNCLLPVGSALANWPRWIAETDSELELSRGRAVMISMDLARGQIAVVNPQAELLGIAEHDGSGRLVPSRWLSRGPVDPTTGLA